MQSQRSLAKILNVSPQHLNAVLRGRVRPSLKLALEIERLTGKPKEQFIPELDECKNKTETGSLSE